MRYRSRILNDCIFDIKPKETFLKYSKSVWNLQNSEKMSSILDGILSRLVPISTPPDHYRGSYRLFENMEKEKEKFLQN